MFEHLRTKVFDCYCFKVSGESIERWLRFIFKTVKSVIARTLYGLYSVLAIWRVTEATQITQYWFLLLALIPLALETLHTIFFKWNKAHKWLVLFILKCLSFGRHFKVFVQFYYKYLFYSFQERSYM